MRTNTWRALLLLAITTTGGLHAGAIENLFSNFWKKPTQEDPAIGVLIVHDEPGVVLEVKGKYKIYDPNTNGYVSTRFVGKRKFVQPTSDGLKWGEEFPGVYQLKIIPDDDKTTTLVDGVEYRGNVYVYDIGGAISVVNEVPVDEFLKATVAPMYETKLPEELASAIAIAARTNLWFQRENSPSKYWSVEAGKVGYEGSAAAVKTNEFSKAILSTHNMVLSKNGSTFPVDWGTKLGRDNPVKAQITLNEAESLASKGQDASKILNQAFPGSSIVLIDQLQ